VLIAAVTALLSGKAWFLRDCSREQKDSETAPILPYSSEVVLMHFNCDERTFGASQRTRYAQRVGRGTPTQSFSVPVPLVNFQEAAPNTIGAIYIAQACM